MTITTALSAGVCNGCPWKLPFSYAALFVLVIGCCLSPAARADELLDQARQLLDQGKATEAYRLLDKVSGQRAGSPDYDLLLGIAALDAGEPTRAVFALERVLAVEPDNARARAELARAYYLAGENEAAKQEFTSIKKDSVPAPVARTIDKYLSLIEGRLAATGTRVNVYIQGAGGYDSNVNSATDSSTIAVPAFGNLVFTLDQSGRKLDSGIFSLGTGFSFSTPFQGRKDLRMIGGINLDERIAYDRTDFSTRVLNGQVGLRYTRGKEAFVVSLQGQKYYLGGDEYRDLGGVGVQWLHNYSRRTRFSLFGQFALQRFPGQPTRNVNQYSGGAGVVHAFDVGGEPIIFASVFAGTDVELTGNRPDLGRNFLGLRTGGQYTLARNLILVGNFTYQYSRYGGADPLFLKRRRDHFLFARAGLEYKLDKNWSLRPEIQYSRNDSNLAINKFDRWQPFITIRNQF
jgi:tetratricopeptide (TPR) repeat protein